MCLQRNAEQFMTVANQTRYVSKKHTQLVSTGILELTPGHAAVDEVHRKIGLASRFQFHTQ